MLPSPYSVQSSSPHRGSFPVLINSAKGDRLQSSKGCPAVPCIPITAFDCLHSLLVEIYGGTDIYGGTYKPIP